MKEINVAILGTWAIHARDFVERNREIPGCNMVAAWDADPVAGRKWAEELDITFVEDYHDILADTDIDAVIITTAAVEHAEMTVEAARAGKHIMVEKAPMLTKESAEAVYRAVQESGVLYSVSDPLVKPEMLQLKKMADDGFFGDITMIHVRNAHAMALEGTLPERFFKKDEAGGGVVLDVGCHGVHMLWWFMGMPESCLSAYSSYTDRARKGGVEDNAAVVYRFPNGAIGIAESSWTSPGDQGIMDIYGTKGCAHAFGRQIHYCAADKVWHIIPKEDLPAQGVKPMDQWLESLIHGTVHTQYHEKEAAELAIMLEGANLATEKVHRF